MCAARARAASIATAGLAEAEKGHREQLVDRAPESVLQPLVAQL